jgi:hypothetical protein
MALMDAEFAGDDELLQEAMEALNGILRKERDAVFEEWPLRLDRCIQQNGEYVESEEFNKHIVIISVLSCMAMLTFSGQPVITNTQSRTKILRVIMNRAYAYDVMNKLPMMSVFMLNLSD